MNKKNSKDTFKLKQSAFNIALLAVFIVLIAIRVVETYIYPGSKILSPDFFLAVVIAQMFFLWFYAVREKNRILWVHKKKEELNEMKSKFTLIASHELMTPITVIKGYIKLMMDKVLGDLTANQKDALNVINKYFKRLESIKDNLTKLSAEPSKSSIEVLRPSSIEAVVRTAAGDMMPFIKKRRQNLEIEIEKGVPYANMDINGIREVLVNLLLNAVRFTPDGGRITVRAKENDGCIRVEVEDNGIGMPADKLENIFESFYELQDIRKHSSGSVEFKSGGIGVGLAIAKNIVTRHKGEIWAESEPNKFSRFIFTLPKA